MTYLDGKMTYEDGQEVHVGDYIEQWPSGKKATVVFIIDRDEWSDGYTKAEWGYLERGFMIHCEEAGLTYFTAPDEDMKLIKRGTP